VANGSNPLSGERAQGLGSAREGIGHWWAQRVTAVALLPLTLWFSTSLIKHAGDNYTSLVLWLRAPPVTTSMVLLMCALFYHMALGLQVVAEDYIHVDRIKVPAVVLIHLISFALAATGILATLRIALGG
jgi:succinate dehydrogenase / fumarate reductase, membrane anchor subunit